MTEPQPTYHPENNYNHSSFPYDLNFVFSMQRYHMIISSIMCVFGSFINFFVILAFLRCRRLRSATNWFVFSLSMSDFTCSAIITPSGAVYYFVPGLADNTFFCVFFNGLRLVILYCTELLSLLLIAIDRFIAVTRPLKYRQIMTRERAKTMVALVWVFSYVFGYVPAVVDTGLNSWIDLCDGYFKYSTIFSLIFVYGLFTFSFLAILVIYAIVFVRARTQLKRKIGDMSNGELKKKVSNSATVAKTMFVIVAIFTIAWVPNMTISQILLHCEQVEIRGQVFSQCSNNINHNLALGMKYYSLTFVVISSAINPLLYSYRIRLLRKEVRKLVLCCLPKKRQVNEAHPVGISIISN
ncbi:adenosine receptor A1-like [Saccoglossus kowalevskii]|uniref:Adenosine receptor A2a-like n=1 Tax=Saccoglossus kowalevskii TaxID=10224 RepID=A0ABM0M5D4_SACKO|nr:PREDICTED: adenosine receptor A2a-like [Saccoglossus kowalevskii]